LSPAEFGLVAMAGAFVWFTTAISDAGLGQTLVRIDRREHATWSSAFWFLSAIGAALSVFLVAIAWPSGWLLQEPRLVAIILVLAPIPLMQAALATPSAELQQREQFRTLAATELTASICGTASALAFAFAGTGAWALVAQQLTYWLLKAVITICTTQFRPALRLNFALLGPHIRFSRDTAALSLVTFFSRQLDPLIIGRLIGAGAVGAYSLASRIAFLPMQFLTFPLQNALFTRMVMIREDRAATRDLILVATWIVAALIFPALAVAATTSAALFEVFLSSKWLPAAPIFTALAPVVCLQSILAISGSMLLAIGATGRRLRLATEFAIVWVVLRRFPLYLDVVGASAKDYFLNIAPPLVCAICAAATTAALHAVWAASALEYTLAGAIVLAGAYASLAFVERGKLSHRLALLRAILAARGEATAPAG
jgi:PST family polysaccharide transporter